MASPEQVQNFISQLSALAITEKNKRDKWVLPSICIAQSALETGWGTSKLMVNANAFFGIKAGTSWNGKVYNSKTNECYDGVSLTEITACFRAYDNLSDSVADYYDLICNNERYSGAVNNADALGTITAIKNGGYATSLSYIDNVMSIVNKYNLIQYDNVSVQNSPASQVDATIYAEHVVNDGDTLWEISESYYGTGTKYTDIMSFNGLTNDTIFKGQVLKILNVSQPVPTQTTQVEIGYTNYIVKERDSLWKISENFYGTGTRYTDIMSFNCLTSAVIHAGDILRIPN